MKNVLYLLTICVILSSCQSIKQDISQVEFQADGCFGECPIFAMTIAADGTASYDAKIFNKQHGQFKTTIKKAQLDSLKMLLDRARFFNLKDNYTTPWTDHSTYTITVKLKDGRSKTIEDYGPSGPEKLKRVHRLIFSFRESQEWK
jgi:hypothetical protein